MNQPLPATRAFDRGTLSTTMQSSGARGVSFAPTDFNGLLEVANLMSASGAAVPKHLRGNPGMCLSVAMTAYQNEFNPYLLAGDTYVVNDVLAYGAKSITAMVNNSPRLQHRLLPIWTGDWPNRRCTVTGRIKGEPKDHEITIYAETITVRNSPLWKSQPDIQLAYYAQRAWGRLYMPEILLGLLDRDEAEEITMRDITPRPTREEAVAEVAKQEPAAMVMEVINQENTFAFVDQDGEEIELDPSAWLNRFAAALDEAQVIEILNGIWESNSGQNQRYRETIENGPKLIETLEARYQANFRRLKTPPAGKRTEPTADTRQNAPRELGKIPVDERGSFDWPAAAHELGAAVETAETIADVEAWQAKNGSRIASIREKAPQAYTQLQARITATIDLLKGGQE